MKRLRLQVAMSSALLAFAAVSCRMGPPRMTDSAVMPVYYATDRKPLMALEDWRRKEPKRGSSFEYYGPEYEPGRLEFGVCGINVPTGIHHVGMVERPGWFGSEGRVAKYFAINNLRPAEEGSFFAQVNRDLATSGCGSVFIFLHGYNVSFSAAALYTSQLAWDWGFRGVPILYSWPSDGSLLGYPKDEESARLTERHLAWFLGELASKTTATNINLVAHSLGGRALAEVLKSFASEPRQPQFGEVILAAPDLNRVAFLQDLAEVLPRVARRVTIYVSSADKALKVSRSFHQFPRVGDATSEPMVCAGIDMIDASSVETDLLGHSYMLRSRAVIADMADVLCRGLCPEQRRLTRVEHNGQGYWKLTD
jgi:esterase/lipase superfamily enzyme